MYRVARSSRALRARRVGGGMAPKLEFDRRDVGSVAQVFSPEGGLRPGLIGPFGLFCPTPDGVAAPESDDDARSAARAQARKQCSNSWVLDKALCLV